MRKIMESGSLNVVVIQGCSKELGDAIIDLINKDVSQHSTLSQFLQSRCKRSTKFVRRKDFVEAYNEYLASIDKPPIVQLRRDDVECLRSCGYEYDRANARIKRCEFIEVQQ